MGKDGVKTVLSIGAFFLGAGGWNPFGLGAIGASGGLMGGMMGMSLMNTIWSATHKPEQPSYDNASRFDQMMNTVSSESMITVIYGRRKWAGNQLWHSASSDGRSLTKDVLVGEGECDGITEVAFNDIPLPINGCSYVFHNGSITQEPPDNFDVVGGYRRMAWLRAHMTISEQLQGNNPTVTYVIKGLKVMDTRTNTVAWSDNNAMCLRDFLLSKRYGISKFVHGMVLDEQSFNEAADYCDQLVNYYDANGVLQQEKRYTLNIILDQKRKANEHLDAILATFGGFLVNNNGVISLRIEKPETSAYHFTNDTIIENSVNVEQLSLDESPNQYKIGYFDETQNWTQVKALVNDIIDQQMPPIGKGKVVTKELTLDGCISQSQALRLGRLYKLKNKLCSLTMTFKTSTFAMHLQCGDVVTMTYDKVDDDGAVFSVFVDKPWRIIELSEQDGVYTVKAREYNESIYGDITEAIHVKSYVPIENPLSSIISPVTNLKISEDSYVSRDGTVLTNIDIAYTSTNYVFFKEYEVYYDVNSNSQWIYYGKTVDVNTVIRSLNNMLGKSVRVGIVTVNSIGRKSTMAISNVLTIVGKSLPPPNVTSFTVGNTKKTLYFKWAKVITEDLRGYEIREGISWDVSSLVSMPFDAQYETTLFTSGNKTYWVKAIDRSGNYSVTPTECSLTVTDAPDTNVVLGLSAIIEGTLPGFYMDDTKYMDDEWYIDSPTVSDDIFYVSVNDWYMDDNYYMDDYLIMDTLTPIDLGSILTFNLMLSPIFWSNLGAKVIAEYQTSYDGVVWSEWIEYAPSTVVARYINVRVKIKSVDGVSNAYVKAIAVTIDVPDITEDDVNIIPTEAWINYAFTNVFHELPTMYVVSQTFNALAYYRNLSKQGFEAILIDRSTGDPVVGSFYYNAKGW